MTPTRGLALILSIAAIAAPSASARPLVDPSPSPPAPQVAPDSGADAELGAAALAAVLLGALAVRRARQRS